MVVQKYPPGKGAIEGEEELSGFPSSHLEQPEGISPAGYKLTECRFNLPMLLVKN